MEAKTRTSPARRIIGDILLVLIGIFTIDIIIVEMIKISSVVLKADYIEVFRYELIICAVLLLFALDVRFKLFTRSKHAFLRAVGWVLRIVVVLLTLVLAFFFGKVIRGGMIDTSGPADNAIVLGLALRKGQPVADLYDRLDTAQAYLEEYPDARLILTGGNAGEADLSEAAFMHDYLPKLGVPDEKMIIEDQATDTKENFLYTAEIIDPAEPVVLITSDYHMDRAARTAESAGFTNILRLPAPSSPLCYCDDLASEVVLLINELIFKR